MKNVDAPLHDCFLILIEYLGIIRTSKEPLFYAYYCFCSLAFILRYFGIIDGMQGFTYRYKILPKNSMTILLEKKVEGHL